MKQLIPECTWQGQVCSQSEFFQVWIWRVRGTTRPHTCMRHVFMPYRLHSVKKRSTSADRRFNRKRPIYTETATRLPNDVARSHCPSRPPTPPTPSTLPVFQDPVTDAVG